MAMKFTVFKKQETHSCVTQCNKKCYVLSLEKIFSHVVKPVDFEHADLISGQPFSLSNIHFEGGHSLINVSQISKSDDNTFMFTIILPNCL